jgi:hypothetical protein
MECDCGDPRLTLLSQPQTETASGRASWSSTPQNRILKGAGELGDRRFVARKRGEREESPDSIVRGPPDYSGSGRTKGSAPGNARGLRERALTPETAGVRWRGYGQCHRKQTAGDAEPRRQARGKPRARLLRPDHLARVKRWGKSPPPGWQRLGARKTPRGARSNRRGGPARPVCVRLARAGACNPRVGCLSPGAIRDLEE